MIRYLTKTERLILIHKHIANGLTYSEACEQINKDKLAVNAITKKEKSDRMKAKPIKTKKNIMQPLIEMEASLVVA